MILTSISISFIAIILSLWLGKKNPVRSSGLTTGMLTLLMLTPLLLVLPKIKVNWIKSDFTSLPTEAEAPLNILASTTSPSLLQVITYTWIAGTALFLLRLAIQSYRIKRWCRIAEATPSARDLKLLEECIEQLGCSKIPEIRYTEKLSSPVITGLLKPTLLLPRSSTSWSIGTLRMVILHELGHLKRKDLWSNMIAHLACAFHWFNPLVWLLRKRLMNECEYACDAHVIGHGADRKSYIHALCDVAESCQNVLNKHSNNSPIMALPMANDASLKNRVSNILKGQTHKNQWMVIAILALSSSITIAYTVVRPHSPNSPKTSQPVEQEEHEPASNYSAQEINKRLSANPFPAK